MVDVPLPALRPLAPQLPPGARPPLYTASVLVRARAAAARQRFPWCTRTPPCQTRRVHAVRIVQEGVPIYTAYVVGTNTLAGAAHRLISYLK